MWCLLHVFFTYLVEQQPDQAAAVCESLFTGLALYFLLIFSLVASLCTPTDDTIYVYPGRSALAPPATFIVTSERAATVQRIQHGSKQLSEPCRTLHPQPTTAAHTAAHCSCRAACASQYNASSRRHWPAQNRAAPSSSALPDSFQVANSDRQRFDGASDRPHSPRRRAMRMQVAMMVPQLITARLVPARQE